MGTALRHTTLENHHTGLALKNDAIIDDQIHGGNKWNGSYTVSASHTGSQEVVSLSEFLVEETSPPMSTSLWPQNPIAAAQWFIPFQGSSSSCQDDPTCQPIPPFTNDTLNDIDFQIADGNLDNLSFVTKWAGDRHIHRKLVNNPSLLGIYSNIDIFYNNNAGTAADKFNQTDLNTKQSFLIPQVEQDNIMSVYTELDNVISDLKVIDQAIDQASSAADSLQLAQDRINLLSTSVEPLEDMFEYNAFTWQSRLANVSGIIAQNAANPGTHSVMIDLKTVNEIYYMTVMQGNYSLDSVQFETIKTIAEKCPFSDGNAVYLARNLYQLYEFRRFDDNDLCGTEKSYTGVNNSDTKDSGVEGQDAIYPNPTNDELHIQTTDINSSYGIRICDINGRCPIDQQLPIGQNQHRISIHHLPTGIYYFQLWRDGNLTLTKRLLVIH